MLALQAENTPLEPDPDNTGGGKQHEKNFISGPAAGSFSFSSTRTNTRSTESDSIVIVATQAAKDAPVAYSRVTREDLVRTAPAQNLPLPWPLRREPLW